MSIERRSDVRNVAIIGHVDHGKSTLIDALLWQTPLLASGASHADVLAARSEAREKTVRAVPKLTSVRHGDVRVDVLDLPGHAYFGREIDRTLAMVDGFLWVVDAVEGAAPQNRFVLRRALESGLAPIVVLNKIDRPGARPDDVHRQVRELFVDLDASDVQLGFPTLYTDAVRGACRAEGGGPDRSLGMLLDAIVDAVPAPAFDPGAAFRMAVTGIGYDAFLGRLVVGRVHHGTLARGATVRHLRHDGGDVEAAAAGLYRWDGLARLEVAEARPGDIVAVTGVDDAHPGDTLADPAGPAAVEGPPRDEPTLAVELSVNDSPNHGREGAKVSAEQLRERLWQELLSNVAIRVEPSAKPDGFRVCGCSELQLAILIEMMRREGFELLVGRLQVVLREADGGALQPVEAVGIDCPEEFSDVVVRKLEGRGGRMTRMVNHGRGRIRVDFRIPTGGLVGFRSEFLADTRRTGILSHAFDAWEPGRGAIPVRSTGALVASRDGRATADAVEHLQSRGTMFVEPGDGVYRGQVVGENAQAADIGVDVTKASPEAPTPPGIPRAARRLIPPRTMSLEQALEFLRDDELLEVTPSALRFRKRDLDGVV